MPHVVVPVAQPAFISHLVAGCNVANACLSRAKSSKQNTQLLASRISEKP